MLNIYQQTIAKPLTFCGIGLHSGQKSKMTIYPGKEDQGIIFKRVDNIIPSLFDANINCIL